MSKKKKKNTGRTVLSVLFALVLIGACLCVGFYFCIRDYNNPYIEDSQELITIEIPSGSSTTKIGYILEDAGIIRSAQIFKFKTKLNHLDGRYQAGTYTLMPSMTMDEITKKLQSGKNPEVSFTIKEGLCLDEVASELLKQGLIRHTEDFYKALEDNYDYEFIPENGNEIPERNLTAKANRLEGYLYPETYRIVEGATSHQIIDTMLRYFNDNVYEYLKDKVPSGYTAADIVTLASIIEEECGADSDRDIISGVFWNRLNRPMRLQSDVTILYPVGAGDWPGTGYDSPYNTYKVDGLPAGPICSPTLKSIESALNPASHNYYYFVLKGDGSRTCFFASTLEEHNRNVEIYHSNPYNY